MTIFQLILFISAMVIFYLFFKKLFSEDYPKRGIDFEAQNADEQIGGISRPDKIFSKSTVRPNRIDELTAIADESVEKGDMVEAQKALQSALIIDENNPDILSRYAYVLNVVGNYSTAKEQYLRLLEITPEDDMAEAALGNICHQLGDDEEAIMHHDRSIELDPEYAPHYYNYANTLYDLEKAKDALELYEQAYRIDPTLDQAQEMITKLKETK